MKNCPQCNTAQESDEITSCPACGYNFAAPTDPLPTETVDDDDDLEFQVYENDSDDREFVGGASAFDTKENKDDLGVQSPDELMESRAHESTESKSQPDPDFEQIGQSAPFIPTPEPYEPEPPTGDFSDLSPVDAAPSEPEESKNGIKKLSEKELRAIENNLYNGSGYLSDSDKNDLMHKLDGDDHLFTATPIVPAKNAEKPELSPATVNKINEEIDPSLPSPKMANRGRGIAFYYRNFIQLRGSQHLAPEDELVIADRLYELRPKTIDRKVLMGAGALAFLLLLFAVGSLFVSSPSGSGQIAGIVLDENNQPFAQGATISLPDLGEETKSNGQGTFVTDRVPSGSHRVELIWDGKTWASDYTTVADNQVSVIVLRPTGEPVYGTIPQQGDQPKRQPVSSATPARHDRSDDLRQASVTTPAANEPPPRKSEPAPAKAAKTSKSADSPGKLVLAANVQGARFRLGDNVLGAGNLAYSGIKPGTYRYEVSRDGYQPATGKVTIGSGEEKTLAVNLEKLAQQVKADEYSADDFYLSGLAALQESDFRAAVNDLAEAVRREPGNADANFSLGEAHAGLKEWQQAHDAFLRAAEQYQIQRQKNRAITAYNQAIQANDSSVPAYLGRANLFLAQKEDRAAVIDFETVVRLDKRNADGYFGLGRARFEQGIYDKAIKHFKDARSIDPSNPLVHQYLMLCYMADSDFDEVKKAYKKFAGVASPEEINRMRSDSRYSAVLRVVDGKH